MNIAVDNIVAIHGAPRSGTSWLGQLFNSSPKVAYRYQPLFSYAFRDRIDVGSDAATIQQFFRDLSTSNDEFVLQVGAGRLSGEELRFPKEAATHLVYKEVRFHQVLPRLLETMPFLRAIGLVRDPKAVIASWVAAPREFDPAWRASEEWRHAPRKNAGKEENWYGFERWKELVRLFEYLEERFPNRFRILRYEDLQQNPAATIGDLFDFCGLTFSDQTRDFIAASTGRDDGDPYGVFRSRGYATSRPSLDAGIVRAIDEELAGTTLKRFLEAH